MPGTEWGSAIVRALDDCRVLVLIFSSNANESPQIRREVERAVSKGIPVIPVRIEDIVPTDALAYFMDSVHWLDALTPPLESHLRRLADSVNALLHIDSGKLGDLDPRPSRSPILGSTDESKSPDVALAQPSREPNEDDKRVTTAKPSRPQTPIASKARQSAMLSIAALFLLALGGFAMYAYRQWIPSGSTPVASTSGAGPLVAAKSNEPKLLPAAPSSPAAPALVEDDIIWNAIKTTGVAVQLEEFVKKYPTSAHAAEAHARLEQMRKDQEERSDAQRIADAKAKADAEAKRRAEEAEQQRLAAHKAEEERADAQRIADAKAKADAEAKRQAASVPTQLSPVQPPPAAVQAPAAPTQPAAISWTPLSLERERALKPKDSFKECDKCPEMIVVPAGSFTMGSPANESEREDHEGPQHRVTLARQFAVGQFELTFDEWDACAAAGGCNASRHSNPGGSGRGRRPVNYVSWDDAKTYVAWLAKMTGKPYRLLSEAEYEYAIRAGTQTAYPWGNNIGKNNANCVSCGSQWDNKETAPVGSFAANGFGLYDMVGNVWEWTADCYHGYHNGYNGAPADGSPWTGGGDCTKPNLRGGSYAGFPEDVRSAKRVGFNADDRADNIGFRVGRTLLAP